MKPNEARALMAQVRENRDKLDACKKHRFSGEIPGMSEGVGAMFGRRIKCLECGGSMDLVALNYYVRGFEAAGGDPNSVLPGWREEGGSSERRFFKDDSEG